MGHGNFKKPPVQAGKPSPTVKPGNNQMPTSTQAPPASGTLPPGAVKQKVVFWADDDDVDFEDITFAVPIVIALVILFVFFLRKYIRWSVPCKSENRLDGKTVIITGGNTGIGRATATELAKRGARVILGCRDKVKAEAITHKIRLKAHNQDVFPYALDLASLSSIKAFADEFNHREPCLHVLINNAAYMGPKATTVEGYERSFGVNYLGHFYLTRLLTDKMKKSAPSRIINVISDSYTKASINFEDLAMTNYDIYKAYARSKLAMVIFNHELHKRLSSSIISSFAVHPGMVCTDLLRSWPGLTGNVLRAAARVLFKSPEDGCQSIVHCAVADKLREHSGKAFENCRHLHIKKFAKDADLGKKLWNMSLHLCNLDHEIEDDAQPHGGHDEKTADQEVQNIGSSNAESKKDK